MKKVILCRAEYDGGYYYCVVALDGLATTLYETTLYAIAGPALVDARRWCRVHAYQYVN